MPMIVDPLAPHVTAPEVVTSPDEWLRASVDTTWAGVVLGVDYTAGTPLADVADVMHVRIVRTDPGAVAPVPVRSADTAWAVEGVGSAYDHEAPLGVGVIYTATPVYADGTLGPTSSLAVTLPEPEAPADVWIKSLDDPGLSARVTVTEWPSLSWASRVDSTDVAGSRFPAAAQDVYASAESSIVLDADGSEIEAVRTLLLTPGVRLIQTRPDYHRPDQFVMFSSAEESVDTTPGGARTFTAGVKEVARPDTAGQPLRIPGWSWDALADGFGTWDAVAASYTSWASLSVNGAV
jgi:hypothetical protein